MASAALPPLPNKMTFPPLRIEVMIALTIASICRGSTDEITEADSASSFSMRRLIAIPPGLQAVLVEVIVRYLHA